MEFPLHERSFPNANTRFRIAEDEHAIAWEHPIFKAAWILSIERPAFAADNFPIDKFSFASNDSCLVLAVAQVN